MVTKFLFKPITKRNEYILLKCRHKRRFCLSALSNKRFQTVILRLRLDTSIERSRFKENDIDTILLVELLTNFMRDAYQRKKLSRCIVEPSWLSWYNNLTQIRPIIEQSQTRV